MENYFFWRVAEYSKFFLSVKYKGPALKLHEVLYGRQSAEQQWKRCVSQLKRLFGIATTAMVARQENEQNRNEINRIIDSVKHQVVKTLKNIPMNPDESKNLVDKISSIAVFAGYSDEFFDDEALENYYSELEIYDGEFFKTAMKLESYLMNRYGNRILKPIADTRWQTFNGNSFQKSFYSSGKGTIYIHPNDLKSPVYNADWPIYINYARLGWQVSNLYGIAVSFEVWGLKFVNL